MTSDPSSSIAMMKQQQQMAAQNNSMYAQLHGAGPSSHEVVGSGIFTQGNTSFNDAAEFEIYDRKFKQASSAQPASHCSQKLEVPE